MALPEHDVMVQSISLTRILQWHILTSRFQRPYEWGRPDGRTGLQRKAIEYFRSFLCNRNANRFFGHVFVYAMRPYEYHRDPHVTVYLADGQHRIATVVLAARVIAERLSEIVQDRQADESDREAAREYLQEPALKPGVGGRIHAVVNVNRRESLLDFIDSAKAQLGQLNYQALKVASRYGADCAALKTRAELDASARGKVKADLMQSKNAELETIEERANALAATPLYNTYLQLRDELDGTSDGAVVRLAFSLINRIGELRVGLTTLQPVRWEHMEALEIEKIAQMLAQMNSDTTPRTLGADACGHSLGDTRSGGAQPVR